MDFECLIYCFPISNDDTKQEGYKLVMLYVLAPCCYRSGKCFECIFAALEILICYVLAVCIILY